MDKAHSPTVVNAVESIQNGLEFGVEVRIFCARNGMRIKTLAQNAGVKYYSLMDTMCGKTRGADLIPKVREYMSTVESLSHEQAVE